MAGSGGRRPGAGRKATVGKRGQRLIARIKPNAGLVFDASLRDSKGHLKQAVIKDLDAKAKAFDEGTKTLKPERIDAGYEMTDAEYLEVKFERDIKIDEQWWAIPAKNRPPFSEFVRSVS